MANPLLGEKDYTLPPRWSFRLAAPESQLRLTKLTHNATQGTRTRTNTNPNGTEANAAGRSVREFDARKSKS